LASAISCANATSICVTDRRRAGRPGAAPDRGAGARRLAPRLAGGENPDPSTTGALLALAYPDRIGRRRVGTANRYLLSGGRGAALPEGDPMSNEEYLVVADLDGAAQDARVFLAAPIAWPRSRRSMPIASSTSRSCSGARATMRWSPRQRRRFGALALADKPIHRPDPEKVKAALLDGVRQRGLSWTDEQRAWRERIAFLRQVDDSWPDLSNAALMASLEDWLAPFVDGAARRIDFAAALKALVPWDRQRQIDALAPTHVEVPSGSRIPIDYANPADRRCRGGFQEMFGLTETPRSAAAGCRC
jgi:ATP-dependent helicase HrpB